jgi:hypothetical protein
MREYKFSKGVWRVCAKGLGVNINERIKVQQKQYIGFTNREEFESQVKANAVLIQSAPNLVLKLENILERLKKDNEDGNWDELISDIDQTLDKLNESPVVTKK